MRRPRWFEPGDEWSWREGRIVAEDLMAFVPVPARHRSLTVVRDRGDRDLVAEGRQWLDRIRVDAADVDACAAMSHAVERWADGSREGQKKGAVALVRLDERGHRGLAAALDQLWSVRASDARDFWRLVEMARGVVLAQPTPPAGRGCRCEPVTDDRRRTGYRSPTKRSLRGLVERVLTADEPERVRVLGWAARKLAEHVQAGALTVQAAAEIVTNTASAAGLDATATAAALRSAGCARTAGAR